MVGSVLLPDVESSIMEKSPNSQRALLPDTGLWPR